ncbi:hypothetical protein BKI52_27350 [marine bacterium AO1-C]|nr:hypothetical protein BKI52_27350 [marine bacterium AO1-C]
MLKTNKILRLESEDPLDNSMKAANILDDVCSIIEKELELEFDYDNYVDEEGGISEISFNSELVALKLVTDENLGIYMIEAVYDESLSTTINKCLEVSNIQAYSLSELIESVTEDDDSSLAILMYGSRNANRVLPEVSQILQQHLKSTNANVRLNAVYGSALNVFYGKHLYNELQQVHQGDENEDIRQHAYQILEYLSEQ